MQFVVTTMGPQNSKVGDDRRRTTAVKAGLMPAVTTFEVTGRSDITDPLNKSVRIVIHDHQQALGHAGDVCGTTRAG